MSVTTSVSAGGLEDLSAGHEVSVYYRSERSGNEVDRSGVVSSVASTEDGPHVRVHVEERGPFKQQYVALCPAKTESGEECVAAVSITVAADADVDDPPRIGQTYAYRLEVERSSILGVVDRVVRDDASVSFCIVYRRDSGE